MKQEKNNEIDLLLRRLSRGQRASASDGDLRDHLDADELSSYAENALPAAARARYTGHLAECSRCRELVVQLSSAAGVVVAEEPSRVSAPSGLRKFLASLFSPMVLRYAVPAMGLIVVAVIGFAVFREGAVNYSPRMAATDRPAATPEVAQQGEPRAGFVDNQPKPGSVAPTPELRGQRKEVESPAPNATPAANAAADVAKDAAAEKTDSQAVATAAPAAPAAPKPADTTDEVRQREPEVQKQKQEEQVRAAATPQADREGRFQSGTPGSVATARSAKSRPLTTAETQAGAGAPTPLKLGDKDRADAETRTVAGRRFRKQEGVWVDTAYGGGARTNINRGSEQYRGLVGDEPEIKTIAEQLDGQIIVVWKGRAYHIR